VATQKEQTLKVNDFLGISRYYNSPNQPPNKLWTIQNMYSPVKGELALIGGVTDITGSGHPGSTGLKYVEFLKTAVGYERVLVFFNHDPLPTPAAPTAVAVTGTSYTGSVSVYVSWVGMGGESVMSAATVVACGAGASIQVTVPAFPTGIVSMNVFAKGMLVAVVSKRNGLSLPASVTLDLMPKTTGVASQMEFRYDVSDFSITFGTSGTLESGKTYFFGISPQIGGGLNQPVTTFAGQVPTPIGVIAPSGRVFSFTVPQGYNSVTITFHGTRNLVESRANSAPFEWTENTTDTASLSCWAYLGSTPDDLMVVGTGIDGTAKPQAQSAVKSLTITMAELPYNSNVTTFKQQSWTPVSTDYSDAYNFICLRSGVAQGFFQYENQSDGGSAFPNNPARDGIGIYAQKTLAFDPNEAYQIMPARGCGYFSNNSQNFTQILSFQNVFVPYSAGQFIVEDFELSSANYLNRLYFANGQQTMFYTNGYVLSTAPRKKLTPYLPITTQVRLFNQRLVAAGGVNTLFNTANVGYYSLAGDPETWTDAPSATAGLSFISALDADSDVIVGIGVYSESLNGTGNSAFLVIGKSRSCYTWNGDSGSGAQQIAERTGFASKNSFAITNYGAIFVGRENVYRMLSSGQAQKIGNDVEPILKGLTDNQIQTVNAKYHDLHLKIGYATQSDITPFTVLDSEIWLNLRQDGGDVLPIFTGPHQMKSYIFQAASNSFEGERDPRISILNNKLYRRDDFTSYLNDGSDIAVQIESNDMGFGGDEFVKVVTQYFMRARINRAEIMSLQMTLYDSASAGQGLDYAGSAKQVFTEAFTLLYGAASGEVYRNFPKQFASRYRGDMLRFLLSFQTNVDFRIASMNWLFNIGRRRLL
jgi:hypothetical protein